MKKELAWANSGILLNREANTEQNWEIKQKIYTNSRAMKFSIFDDAVFVCLIMQRMSLIELLTSRKRKML